MIYPHTLDVGAGFNGAALSFANTSDQGTPWRIYIDNGETAGELAESMDRASKEYQDRADNCLKMIGVVGFACMLIFVALMALGIAVFAMQQYINMLNSLMTIWSMFAR